MQQNHLKIVHHAIAIVVVSEIISDRQKIKHAQFVLIILSKELIIINPHRVPGQCNNCAYLQEVVTNKEATISKLTDTISKFKSELSEMKSIPEAERGRRRQASRILFESFRIFLVILLGITLITGFFMTVYYSCKALS